MKKDKSTAEYKAGKRATKSGSFSILVTAIIVVAALGLNLLVNLLPSSYTKIEAAKSNRFEPSDETAAYIKELPQKIDIYLVAQSGKEESKLLFFLEKAAALSKNLSVTQVDPALKPEFLKNYTNETVADNSFIVVSGERSKLVKNSDIFVYNYGINSETSQYYVQSIGFNGDDLLLSALKYVMSDSLPTVYILEGHGELALPSGYYDAITKENIKCESLSLLAAGGVPQDAASVILNVPQNDISAEEAAMLKAYLEKGGDLLVVTDGSSGPLPQNLKSVLAYYGMEQGDVIFEENTGRYYQYDYYLLPELQLHDITGAMIDAKLPVLSPLSGAIYETSLHRDTITVKPLLSSSGRAWTGKITGGNLPQKNAATDTGSFYAGAIAEEKVGDATARVVWYSSAGITDKLINARVSGSNSTLFVNTLAYLCDFKSAIGAHSQAVDINYLVMSSSQSTTVGVVIAVILPISLLAAGAIVYFKRRAR